MDVLDKVHATVSQSFRGGGYVIRFEVQVEVFAFANELERRIRLVHELQMDHLIAGSDARVEAFVLEL